MRTILISLGAAAASLTLAAPAAAQWAPHHGAPPHGHAWGYHSNHGQVRALQVRINQLQRHIIRLDQRNIIRSRDAQRLHRDARDLERRLVRNARNGLTIRQRQDIEMRLARIEQRVAIASRAHIRHDPRRGYDPRWGYRGW